MSKSCVILIGPALTTCFEKKKDLKTYSSFSRQRISRGARTRTTAPHPSRHNNNNNNNNNSAFPLSIVIIAVLIVTTEMKSPNALLLLLLASTASSAVYAVSPQRQAAFVVPALRSRSIRGSSPPWSSSSPTRLQVGTAPPPLKLEGVTEEDDNLPQLGDDGIYHILNKEQHQAFLEAHPDKLVVVKFFAPWCRACKGLEPKFLQIVQDEKYQDLPMLWADLSIQHNKDFVKSLGVLALPSVQFYANGGLVESFPCGPSKVPILKRKLAQFITDRVDVNTKLVKQVSEKSQGEETEPCTTRTIMDEVGGNTTELTVGGVAVSKKQWNMLRNDIPFFKDFDNDEFQQLMSKAKLLTFEPSAVIMREGKKGRTFYVIESGEVEVFVKTAFEDPLTTPPSYLGTMVNCLQENDYFGERCLITGERRAASIRATNKTRCFAFDIDDIPASSILSGKKQASMERIQQVNEKYGVDVYDIDFLLGQFRDANMGNQVRGSLNTPRPIKGVDTEEEEETTFFSTLNVEEDLIIPLLVRFKLIRHAARCFDYIMSTQPKWGDPGELRRRSMLVSKLTAAQVEEFTEVFKVIDSTGDGLIELIELKKVMESIGEVKTDEEIMEMINKGNVAMDGNQVITYQDFMGVMAEAEFYHLFKDTFGALDKRNSGYIKASDVDRVLCGMRDLICDDHKSIIDVEDMDMMIDYEQFSKMLLGIALS